MKVGIIAPIKFLERYCVTSIQYCLPSLVVENTSYKNFYIKKKKIGNIIISDSRKVGWRRTPEDFEVIREALKLIEPDIIVAPSYMFNLKASLEMYEYFLANFPTYTNKIIRCLEGTSEEDVVIFPKSKIIAVPSHMYRYIGGIKFNSNTIYLENHISIDELDNKKGILVTSLPIRLGLQGRLLSNNRPAPDSLTFFEEEDKYPKIVEKNIKDLIDYYKD